MYTFHTYIYTQDEINKMKDNSQSESDMIKAQERVSGSLFIYLVSLLYDH